AGGAGAACSRQTAWFLFWACTPTFTDFASGANSFASFYSYSSASLRDSLQLFPQITRWQGPEQCKIMKCAYIPRAIA
ncbi:hypothetical protein, partial [Gluconobacter kondonii]|uniref:hypothetical protein n=1 Tax=Gluconobacter kondonii TaxID=941463 RepID=UPI002231E59C